MGPRVRGLPDLVGAYRSRLLRDGKQLVGLVLRARPGVLRPGRRADVPARIRGAALRLLLDRSTRRHRLLSAPSRQVEVDSNCTAALRRVSIGKPKFAIRNGRTLPMKTRRMGNTGLKVSEICLGTMTFAGQCDEKTSFAIID